jgi:hypothetical protein
MPDPVMFQRFLDATNYLFGCSDDSSTGSYDQADDVNVAGAGDGEAPQNPGTSAPGTRGQVHLQPHQREAWHQRTAGSSSLARG